MQYCKYVSLAEISAEEMNKIRVSSKFYVEGVAEYTN